MDASMPLRLELINITKQFPGVLANDNVSFSVKPGEIHALLGENGAGKSTLVKMIYGIMQPDAGEIRWDGQPVVVANPKAARKLGIGMVGSRTKRARFASWYRAEGGDETALDRLVLPIGNHGLGDKRPEVIAALAAAEIMVHIGRREARSVQAQGSRKLGAVHGR